MHIFNFTKKKLKIHFILPEFVCAFPEPPFQPDRLGSSPVQPPFSIARARFHPERQFPASVASTLESRPAVSGPRPDWFDLADGHQELVAEAVDAVVLTCMDLRHILNRFPNNNNN